MSNSLEYVYEVVYTSSRKLHMKCWDRNHELLFVDVTIYLLLITPLVSSQILVENGLTMRRGPYLG